MKWTRAVQMAASYSGMAGHEGVVPIAMRGAMKAGLPVPKDKDEARLMIWTIAEKFRTSVEAAQKTKNPFHKQGHYSVYVLRLQDECWYIGITRGIVGRSCRHFGAGLSAKWVAVHPAVNVHEVRQLSTSSTKKAAHEENAVTLEYARKYGTDKVRGGGFCQMFPRWPEDMGKGGIPPSDHGEDFWAT